MPYIFTPEVCAKCPFGYCFEDRRNNPIPGRDTKFRVLQRNAISCTFQTFAPGSANDFVPGLTFDEYITQFTDNINQAGSLIIGNEFKIEKGAFAKVHGDVLEILEGAALWNAAVVWNNFMRTGEWSSRSLQPPENIRAEPQQLLAIIKLPRGYDATQLFSHEARLRIRQLEERLAEQGQILKLSAPDIVGVRLPNRETLELFSTPIENLSAENINRVETSYRLLEAQITAGDLLFAIAVKRTMRSDRLYQPLYEANVLKYLLHGVLGQTGFRFFVHAVSIEGADVEGHYMAPSIYSLLGQEVSELAVDRLFATDHPTQLAQEILNEFPALTGMVG